MTRSGLYAVCCVFLIGTAPAQAEGPRPFPQFTFKKIGVPAPGSTGGRITVQIDPAEQAAALAVPEAAQDEAAATVQEPSGGENAPDAYAWFWGDVAPGREGAGPANVTRALAVLRDNPGEARAPRLQDLQDIAQAHGRDILSASIGTRVSPALVLAVIAVESGGNPAATSGAGAEGLMQLIPATAERFGVSDSTAPTDNIKGGVAYLSWLMDAFDQDPILALAGYNAGENAVRQHDGVPPFAETRAYVPKVLSAWQVARGLCQTPPELISDGCVFAVKGDPGNG